MANAVTEAFDAVQKSLADMRKDNDQSLAELSKGNDVKFRELQEKCDKQEAHIVDLIKTRNDLQRQRELMNERVDLLEALSDRPKGDIVKKLVNEDEQLFYKQVRSGFTDREATIARDNLARKALEFKTDTVTAGTALLGGSAVPKVISDQIDHLVLRTSGIVDAIGVKTVGTSDYNKIVTISGQSGAWAAELGTRSQGNAPNTRIVKPTQGELYSYLFASKESMMDLMFNVQEWLVGDVAESQSVKMATAIYNGNGSGQPTGMTNTTPTAVADYASPMRAAAVYEFVSHSGVDTSSPAHLTFDILLAGLYKLAAPYRANAKWAMNTVTQGIARRLKTTTNEYLWQPSLQAGQPDMLFGFPLFTWEDLADGNTNDGFVAAVGDFPRSYELVQRNQMDIVIDPYTTVGTTKFWLSKRWGGIPSNNNAVKFIRNAD